MAEELRRELQQLSPAQLRELLSASGHGQLLREGEEKKSVTTEVDEQLVVDAKNEGNALFRQGRMDDAVTAYSRSLDVVVCIFYIFYNIADYSCCGGDASRCLEMDPSNAVCLSNRAAAYLKVRWWYSTDASMALYSDCYFVAVEAL